MSELTNEEKTLLIQIAHKGIKEIKLKISSEGIRYKDLDEIIEKEEYDWNELPPLFESIVKKGYLKPTEHIYLNICPECSSPHVYTKYSCPRCKSINVPRNELIEHAFCGYTDIRKKFVSGADLICPNCSENLGSIHGRPRGDGSRKDYRVIGSSFECEDCGDRFDRPDHLHFCQSCSASFDYKTSRYEKLYNYEIPEDVIEKLRMTQEIMLLIVEDNVDDAKIISRIISKVDEDIKIEHVISGKEAMNQITNKFFDIILLDYKLPDMSGIEILKKIKEKKIQKPVIMLTGADDRQIAVEAMKLGASDYLVKSLETYEKLPSIINKLVQK